MRSLVTATILAVVVGSSDCAAAPDPAEPPATTQSPAPDIVDPTKPRAPTPTDDPSVFKPPPTGGAEIIEQPPQSGAKTPVIKPPESPPPNPIPNSSPDKIKPRTISGPDPSPN